MAAGKLTCVGMHQTGREGGKVCKVYAPMHVTLRFRGCGCREPKVPLASIKEENLQRMTPARGQVHSNSNWRLSPACTCP